MNLNQLILAICLLINLKMFGQNSDTLKTVEVHAKKDSLLRFSVINSSVPQYRFTKQNLIDLGSEDAGDALKFAPGTYIKDYGGIGGLKTISFRSLGGAHTSIETDGVVLPNPQIGSVNLSQVDVFSINQLEMTSGQVQSHFSSASSYVNSNIISIKSELATLPEGNNDLRIMSRISSINAYSNGISFRQKIGEKFSFGLQGLITNGSGQYSFRLQNYDSTYFATRQNSELLNYSLRSALVYKHKNFKLLLVNTYFNNYQKLPGAVVLYNPYNNQDLKNTNLNSTFKLEYENEKWALGYNLFGQKSHTTYNDFEYLNVEGILTNHYDLLVFGSGIIASRLLNSTTQKIFIGTDFISSSLSGNQFSSSPTRSQQNSVIGFSKWVKKIKIQANLTHQFIYDQSTDETLSYCHFSPFVSLAYLPLKKHNLRIRTHFKNAYRLPKFSELYYNTIGNKNLVPENANNFNFGMTFSKKIKSTLIESTLDLYQAKINNKIVAIPTKDLFNWSIQNIGSVQSRGIDVNVFTEFNMNKLKLALSTSQSWNTSVDITNMNSSSYGHQIPYSPQYSSTYNLKISKVKTAIILSMLQTGKRYTLNENIPSNLLKGFIDISASINHTLDYKKHTFFFKAQVSNLLNNNYEVIRSFPMPGRFYSLKIIYNVKT